MDCGVHHVELLFKVMWPGQTRVTQVESQPRRREGKKAIPIPGHPDRQTLTSFPDLEALDIITHKKEKKNI